VQQKRLLIISHNCLSTSGSNGRTLLNYLKGWQTDKIAQLYIHPEEPDFSLCKRFYCLSDKSVINSIIKRKPAGYVVEKKEAASPSVGAAHSARKKNSLIFFARIAAWKSRLWKAQRLNAWVDEFKPEVILVQAGDFGPLFDLAVSIKKKYNAELVVYNTEGYYFKKESYFREGKLTGLFYRSVYRNYLRSYNRLTAASGAQIYNCDLLKQDYDKALGTESCVIMNSSQFTGETEEKQKSSESVVYAGNLGLYRYKSIVEFAEALADTAPDMYVDVYGKLPDAECEAAFGKCKNIIYKGFISYEELKKILKRSKYLLHVESFDEFYRQDLKYAFSTKIADSLAVGACLFVYAPENMAVCRYLDGKNASVLINSKSELRRSIAETLNNEDIQSAYMANARALALENHELDANRDKFQKILCR